MAKALALSAADIVAEAPLDGDQRASWWRKLWASFAASSLLKNEDEAGLYIQMHGGALTDEIERDIARRFGRGAGIG